MRVEGADTCMGPATARPSLHTVLCDHTWGGSWVKGRKVKKMGWSGVRMRLNVVPTSLRCWISTLKFSRI